MDLKNFGQKIAKKLREPDIAFEEDCILKPEDALNWTSDSVPDGKHKIPGESPGTQNSEVYISKPCPAARS